MSDAAKYDASCSSSGSARDAATGAIGNGAVGGICHTWAADGRCVSLLKVLLSNACAYDCAYCVNRRSNDAFRTGFEPEELVRLTLDFYKRNYIEGLFLSSGVVGCPDATMERLIHVARLLRKRERWNGYLHLKAIPGASGELVIEAARYADRVSVNVELPSAASLASVAPDKSPAAIFGVMRTLARASGFEPRKIVGGAGGPARAEAPRSPLRPALAAASSAPPGKPTRLADSSALLQPAARPALGGVAPRGGAPAGLVAETAPEYSTLPTLPRPSPVPEPAAARSVMEERRGRYRNPGSDLLPAGQTTQLVIGASPESDADILRLAENLYLAYDVRRVYYSAFVPAGADPRVPALPGPPLLREHRLYQADWLFRFYGFRADEILDPAAPFLDRDLDPKCAWALRHLECFPVEVNTADYLSLLRVPGIGPTSAARIVRARRGAKLSESSLAPLGVALKRAAFFVTCSGAMPAPPGLSRPIGADAGIARAFLSNLERGRPGPLQPELDWAGTCAEEMG